MSDETEYLSVRSKDMKIPEYSLTGDLLSFLQCGLQYRYHNKGSLPPSKPVQLWFGEFIHGVMEQAYLEWAHDESKRGIDWDWHDNIRDIEMEIYKRLDASGIRPTANVFCYYDENETGKKSCIDNNHPHKRIASKRAELAINKWGKHLFPLINEAEIKLKDIQPMPNYDEDTSRSKFYGITGIIDVISSVHIQSALSDNLILHYLNEFGLNEDDAEDYEIIIDYKGMKRPAVDDDAWKHHKWQILTYALLRSQQPDAKKILAGIIFYFNELEPSEENMKELKRDVANSKTDIMPEETDQNNILAWRKGRRLPNLSQTFKEQRSIRIIKIEPDEIENALSEFKTAVSNIESCVYNEIKGNPIKESWGIPENPRESTCTACDFKTICNDPAPNRYRPTVP